MCWNNLEQASTITINGVTMSMTEYRKMIRQNTKKRKAKKELNTIQLLPNEIAYLMKQVRVIKSLGAYYNNGYRQWGTKCKDFVLQLKETRVPFLLFNNRSKELFEIMQSIQALSKKKEKSVFQYVEKFAYKLDDIKEQMQALCNGVKQSRVIEQFKDYEFINGQGRRLGLKILMIRTSKAIDEIDVIINRLSDITTKGVDAFEYRNEISKWGDTI